MLGVLNSPVYVRDSQGGLCIIRQEFVQPPTYYFSLVSANYKMNQMSLRLQKNY